MKTTEKKINTEKLNEIIKKWRINVRALAAEIGMPESTFKKKLAPNSAVYNFTEQEYLSVIIAIGNMISQVQLFYKQEYKNITHNNIVSKK